MSGYLWYFMIYSRAESDATNIDPPDISIVPIVSRLLLRQNLS
jgi:hypothetical protein